MDLLHGPLLIVSPHMDDAALSCAALLSRSEPVDVLTVFAGAPEPPRRGWWDEVCGFSDSLQSTAARRAEEIAAFACSPHRLAMLDLLEEQHLVAPRGSSDREVIASVIRDWVGGKADPTVALPAGAGASRSRVAKVAHRVRAPSGPKTHPDHLVVRDAGLAAVEWPRVNVLLYEEFPYLRGGTADVATRRVARRLRMQAELVVVEIDRAAKARRIGVYASQFRHEGALRLDRPTELPQTERYWRLRRL